MNTVNIVNNALWDKKNWLRFRKIMWEFFFLRYMFLSKSRKQYVFFEKKQFVVNFRIFNQTKIVSDLLGNIFQQMLLLWQQNLLFFNNCWKIEFFNFGHRDPIFGGNILQYHFYSLQKNKKHTIIRNKKYEVKTY